MAALFAQSLQRHLRWWLASLWPGQHPGTSLGLRRLLFLLLGYPAFLALQLVHWLGLLCDECFFRGYRRVELQEPLFVLGIPRSGTTFLHRHLALDRQRYTAFSTWEAVLAPSITERRCLRAAAALDRACGHSLRRLTDGLLRRLAGSLDEIHAVDLAAPEEDYLAMLPAGSCFILLLAFPFSPELRALGHLSTLPPNERQTLLRFYRSLLQRHLYCHPGKKLLSKNAAFATWGAELKATFPQARFLVCLREPATALSSQLSSLAGARQLSGSDPDGSLTRDLFTDLYAAGYRDLAAFISACPTQQTALIAQSDLRSDPAGTIRAALRQTGIELGPILTASLDQLRPAPPSGHQHSPEDFSLDTEQLRDCMRPAYEAMLRSPNRCRP